MRKVEYAQWNLRKTYAGYFHRWVEVGEAVDGEVVKCVKGIIEHTDGSITLVDCCDIRFLEPPQ